jgi:hypothetical protein
VLFAGFFAERLRGWLTLDGGGDLDRLNREIRVVRLDTALRQLHEQLAATDADPAFAFTAVTDALSHSMATASPRFAELVKTMWDSYAPQAGDGIAIWREHQRRDANLSRPRRANFEQALERTLTNLTFQRLVRAPSLFNFVAGLALRYAVLRFLLVSLLPVIGGAEEVERTLVSVIYSLSRSVDHSDECKPIDAERIETLDQVAALAKV